MKIIERRIYELEKRAGLRKVEHQLTINRIIIGENREKIGRSTRTITIKEIDS